MQRRTKYIGICRLAQDNIGRSGFLAKERLSERDNGRHDKRTQAAGCDKATHTLHGQEARDDVY